ncbi:MAG TPA: ATP-binding protein, partial [Myxococcales bacterium]
LNDELQLRNSELNTVNGDLLNVMNSVEIPVVIVDGARRIRRFTPKAVSLINLRATDVGRPIDEIKSNLVVANLDQQIAEVIDRVTTLESDVQDREGRWYRLQIRPYLSVEKRIDGAVLTVVDIDALKRALGTSEWARDYAASTVEAVQTPLVVLDQRLAVLSANESFYEVFHTSKDETERRRLFDLGNGQWEVPALRHALEEMLAKNSRFSHLEIAVELEGLGPRVLSLAAGPIFTMTGVPMILLSIDDITDRKRHEEERTRLLAAAEDARASAEKANRTKDVFLAVLSHELRTPLSSLLLQAQLLRKAAGDPAKLERASEAIERAAKAQAQLIDDLLDVSRIASGKLKVEFQVVNLAGIVGNAVETVRPAAEKKSLKLEVAVDESAPPVSGDPARLQQVVLNLLTNAIKFTSAGGRVSLALDWDGDHARIRVSDTGSGIEPDFLPYVFDTFAQADPTRTRTHGGLGLGLSISRYLVERHGGTIRAESPGKGAGTTVTVSLPVLERARQEAILPHRGPLAQTALRELRGVKLLIVEDDPGTREALAEMLSLYGVEIKTAASAAEAMEVFEGFAPQVLLCDIAMPDEDGVSLLRRIRALGPYRHGDVPAVALTALAGEEDRQRSLSAGFQLHLVKPLGIDHLVEVLATLLQREGHPSQGGAHPGP